MAQPQSPNADQGLRNVATFLAKSVASLVPGGGIAAELITLVVGDPATRRRDQLLNDIAIRLAALEAESQSSIAELAADERVSSIVLHALQIVQRSVGEQKYEALRNATLRGTFDPSARSLTPIVLGILDRLTDNHLYILKGMSRYRSPVDPSTPATHFQMKYWGTSQPVSIGFAQENRPKGDGLDPSGIVFKTVWSDLVGLGLIQEARTEARPADPDRGSRAAPGRPTVQITQLSLLVLDHVAGDSSGVSTPKNPE